MAERRRSSRVHKERVSDTSFIVGSDSSAVLGLVTVENCGYRMHAAVGILASRVYSATGELLIEQRASGKIAHELRMADAAAHETQDFLVLLKTPRTNPCWYPAADVGASLVSHFKHLLHIFPHVNQLDIPGVQLLHACFLNSCSYDII